VNPLAAGAEERGSSVSVVSQVAFMRAPFHFPLRRIDLHCIQFYSIP